MNDFKIDDKVLTVTLALKFRTLQKTQASNRVLFFILKNKKLLFPTLNP